MSSEAEPWTIGRLLNWTVGYLRDHGAENPRLDAEVLLAQAQHCRRIDLYASFDMEPDDKARAAFRELVRRRAAGTPVAYLVGHKEFYALDFEVTPDVLIPRPETELLIVALLDHAKRRGSGNWGLGAEETFAASDPQPPIPNPQSPSPGPQICDVGTGSGILGVTAAKYLPQAQVTAIDISPTALVVARRNAEKHGVAERIMFFESNLFDRLPAEVQFNYILSNPPYVTTAEMAELPKDVRDHEPHIALDAGERGTAVIEPLVQQAADRLLTGGLLLMEVSPMIAGQVEQIVRDCPSLALGPTIRDLAGHARVVQAGRR
jgi:release factor glutamine methyltransferase